MLLGGELGFLLAAICDDARRPQCLLSMAQALLGQTRSKIRLPPRYLRFRSSPLLAAGRDLMAIFSRCRDGGQLSKVGMKPRGRTGSAALRLVMILSPRPGTSRLLARPCDARTRFDLGILLDSLLIGSSRPRA